MGTEWLREKCHNCGRIGGQQHMVGRNVYCLDSGACVRREEMNKIRPVFTDLAKRIASTAKGQAIQLSPEEGDMIIRLHERLTDYDESPQQTDRP